MTDFEWVKVVIGGWNHSNRELMVTDPENDLAARWVRARAAIKEPGWKGYGGYWDSIRWVPARAATEELHRRCLDVAISGAVVEVEARRSYRGNKVRSLYIRDLRLLAT